MEMNLEKQQRGQMVASLTGHSKDFAFYFGGNGKPSEGFGREKKSYVLKIITLATLLTIW